MLTTADTFITCHLSLTVLAAYVVLVFRFFFSHWGAAVIVQSIMTEIANFV